MQLGPFRLAGPAGRGGMGVVWRGKHARSGLDVAVKFLHPSADSWRSAALQAEIRALAGLDHPGIVRLLDAGIASPAPPGVDPGSPYLVEEWVGGGDLALLPPRSWEELSAVVLDLLEALGHAHARGVLHRDLKPSNVLRAQDGRWRLVDFGVCRTFGGRSAEQPIAGTPAYMAPEQATGDGRAEGPATDLYALGCLVWTLVSGAPPFSGAPADVLRAHLREALPELVPQIAVPAGLHTWLRAALARDPRRRWALAADAAAGWRALEGPLRASGNQPSSPPALADSRQTWVFSDQRARQLAIPPPSDEQPPLPAPAPAATWPTRASAPPSVLDAGVRLIAWRRPPLVGREAEQALLWRALLRRREQGGQELVVVLGPSGVGRSGLLSWLFEATHSTGMALPLRVGSDGLGVAVLGALGLADLHDGELHQRLARFPPPAAEALERLVSARDQGPRAGALSEVRALVALGVARPLLLIFDDLIADDPRLLVIEVLRSGAEWLPPTLVVTAPEGDGSSDGVVPASGISLQLAPLDEGAMLSVLDELLPLEAGTRAALLARCAGLPGLSSFLVHELVLRGALLATPEGYALAPGEKLDLPADLLEAWRRRYDVALLHAPAAVGHALELAATWGMSVPEPVWRSLCEAAELVPDAPLWLALDRGLVEVDERGGLSFPHTLAREALLAMAREQGRWPRWSRLCAREMSRGAEPAAPERRALHLIAAGEDEAALGELTEAIGAAVERGRYATALMLSRTRRAAMDRLGLPADHPSRIEGWEPELTALRMLHHLEEGRRLAEERVRLARATGDTATAVVMLRELALLAEGAGQIELSRRTLREARAEAEALGPGRLLGSVTYFLAGLLRRTGELEEAELLGHELVASAERLGAARPLRVSVRMLSDILALRGRLEEARALALRALALAQESGDLEELGSAFNALGELDRREGKLEAAERHYREAQASLRAVGLPPDGAVELNLAQILLRLGQRSEAHALAQRVLHGLPGTSHAYLSLGARLVLASLAADGDESVFDEHFGEASRIWESTRLFDPDFVALLSFIADAARGGGQEMRAAAAERLRGAVAHNRKGA